MIVENRPIYKLSLETDMDVLTGANLRKCNVTTLGSGFRKCEKMQWKRKSTMDLELSEE